MACPFILVRGKSHIRRESKIYFTRIKFCCQVSNEILICFGYLSRNKNTYGFQYITFPISYSNTTYILLSNTVKKDLWNKTVNPRWLGHIETRTQTYCKVSMDEFDVMDGIVWQSLGY